MTKILGRPDILENNLTGQILYTEAYARGDALGVGVIPFTWPTSSPHPIDTRTGVAVNVVAARFNTIDPVPKGQLRILLLVNGQPIPGGTIEIPLVETEYGAIDLRKINDREGKWFTNDTVQALIDRANAAMGSIEDYRQELDTLHGDFINSSNIKRYLTPTEREYDNPPNGTWAITYSTNQLHYRGTNNWISRGYITGSVILTHTATRDVPAELMVAEAGIIQTMRANVDCRIRMYGSYSDALRDRSRGPGAPTGIPIAADVVVRANEVFLLSPPAFIASATRNFSLLVTDTLSNTIDVDIKIFAMNSGGL